MTYILDGDTLDVETNVVTRLGLSDGLDVEARARWPLDPVALAALGSGKQGAKA